MDTRIFVAGAAGVVGRQLVPLLVAAGYETFGTTRSPGKRDQVAALGAEPVVVDVFDAAARNARIRSEGTRNLVAAALLALQRGKSGVFNFAESDGYVSSAKARRELGWVP